MFVLYKLALTDKFIHTIHTRIEAVFFKKRFQGLYTGCNLVRHIPCTNQPTDIASSKTSSVSPPTPPVVNRDGCGRECRNDICPSLHRPPPKKRREIGKAMKPMRWKWAWLHLPWGTMVRDGFTRVFHYDWRVPGSASVNVPRLACPRQRTRPLYKCAVQVLRLSAVKRFLSPFQFPALRRSTNLYFSRWRSNDLSKFRNSPI